MTRRGALLLAAGAGTAVALRGWIEPLEALAGSPAGPRSMVLGLSGADFAAGAQARSAGALRTSHVLRAPRRFDLVGLRWADRVPVRALVRARRDGGAWGPWTPIAAGADHAPDGAARRASEPVWVGGADELQLRLPERAALPRLHLVSVPAGARAARARAAATPAPGGGPPIVARAEWGGDAVPPRAAPSYGTVDVAFVHHTVNANDYGPADSPGMVLAIAKYHRDANGWNDLGYNFVVDRYGQIFEGRAGGIEQAVIGAQAQGYNARSTGVAVLGTFQGAPLDPAGIAALGQLIGWKLARHGTPASGPVTLTSAGGATNRYPAGQAVTLDRVSGHRDGDRTECPGAALHAQLPEIRERAARAAAGIAPVPVAAVQGVVLRAVQRRVRARGRGVLLRGRAAGPVRLGVAVQSAGRWKHVRNVAASKRSDGSFTVRLALRRPGLYKITATADGIRSAPAYVRSIRGT